MMAGQDQNQPSGTREINEKRIKEAQRTLQKVVEVTVNKGAAIKSLAGEKFDGYTKTFKDIVVVVRLPRGKTSDFEGAELYAMNKDFFHVMKTEGGAEMLRWGPSCKLKKDGIDFRPRLWAEDGSTKVGVTIIGMSPEEKSRIAESIRKDDMRQMIETLEKLAKAVNNAFLQ